MFHAMFVNVMSVWTGSNAGSKRDRRTSRPARRFTPMMNDTTLEARLALSGTMASMSTSSSSSGMMMNYMSVVPTTTTTLVSSDDPGQVTSGSPTSGDPTPTTSEPTSGTEITGDFPTSSYPMSMA